MLKIECAHHYASVLCTFFLGGGGGGCALSLWFACRWQSTIINRLSLSVSLSLSLSLSPSLSLLLSLSLSLSPSLSFSPTPKLSLSLSLSLPLIHSWTFFQWHQVLQRLCHEWLERYIRLLCFPPLLSFLHCAWHYEFLLSDWENQGLSFRA